MSTDIMNFAFEPRHDRPGEEDWRWSVCAGRISREVIGLFARAIEPDAPLAEMFEVVAHDVRAAAALRLEALHGRYEPPLTITAEDHAAWAEAGRPDGDLKV